MSTKIYNAYKFKGKHRDIIPFLNKFKPQVEKKVQSIFDTWIQRDIEIKIPKLHEDGLAKFKPSEVGYDSLRLISLWEHLCNQDFVPRGNVLHYNPTVCVYFFNDDIFMQFFDLDVDGVDELEDYHYQNSTDLSNYDWRNEKWNMMTDERKEELEVDWSTRRTIWDTIFSDKLGLSTPREAGLSYKLTPSLYKLDGFMYNSLKKYKKEK